MDRKPRRIHIKEGHAEIDIEQEILKQQENERIADINNVVQNEIQAEQQRYNKKIEDLRNILRVTNKKK